MFWADLATQLEQGLSTTSLSLAGWLIGMIPCPPFGEFELDFASEESKESEDHQKEAKDYNNPQ
jgi:hypothetical protein